MINRVGLQLNRPRRIALTTLAILAIALPIMIGVLNGPVRAASSVAAQSPTASAASTGPTFDVVSIKPCDGNRTPANRGPAPPAGFRSGIAPWAAQTSPGYVYWDCATLSQLAEQAFADRDHPLLNTLERPRPDSLQPKRVRGGPSWVDTDKFTVEARAPLDVTNTGLAGAAFKNLGSVLPPAMSQALRVALESRFQLKVHRATEQQDMYALTIAKSGLNTQKVTAPKPGDCLTTEQYSAAVQAAPDSRVISPLCGRAFVSRGSTQFSSFTFAQLATFLSGQTDYFVLDRTGVTGPFNFELIYASSAGGSRDDSTIQALAALGLAINREKGPAEYLVIDQAQKPRPNAPAEFVEPPARAAGPGTLR